MNADYSETAWLLTNRKRISLFCTDIALLQWLARLRLASRAQREIFRTHLIGQLTVTRHR